MEIDPALNAALLLTVKIEAIAEAHGHQAPLPEPTTIIPRPPVGRFSMEQPGPGAG